MESVKGLLQVVLLVSVVACVLSATISSETKASIGKATVAPAALASEEHAVDRVKRGGMRYLGWGRHPGLRYSKAMQSLDHDSVFNKMFNNFDKRNQESNFRELRMKQRPQMQNLLPHLFGARATRGGGDALPDPAYLGMADVDAETPRLTEEDVDTLMYLLDDYVKNLHSNDQQ